MGLKTIGADVHHRFLKLISLFRCYRAIKAHGGDRDMDRALDAVFLSERGVIRPLQRRFEIRKLLDALAARKPRVIVEIGTASGGNLFLFTRVAAADAVIVSIDLPAGAFGGGYGWWRIPLYRSFARQGQKIHLIRGDSHAESTVEELKRLLAGKKIDFLFIDGDHTYNGVKRDFAIYHPLVGADGLVALHDIVAHAPESGCEVDRFWREVKQAVDWQEIVEDRETRFAGIGLITSIPKRGARAQTGPSVADFSFSLQDSVG